VDLLAVAPHWRWPCYCCVIYAVNGAPSRGDICDAYVLADPDLLDAWLAELPMADTREAGVAALASTARGV
jgi:hypothetical protein